MNNWLKKISIIVVGIFWAGISCSTASARGGRTVVAGEVIGRSATDPAIVMWYLDDPFGSTEQLAQRLAADGSFRFETEEITHLHDVSIVIGRSVRFLIAPGDSIHLTIDADRMRRGEVAEAVRFGGDRAKENAELVVCLEKMIRLQNDEPLLDLATTPDNVLRQIRERMARYEDSLNRFASVGSEVRDFMRRELLFNLANSLLAYEPRNPAARVKLLGDSIFGIHDEANLRTMMFPYHLNFYADTRTAIDTTIFAAIRDEDYALAARKTVGVLTEEPATGCRDVMLWGSMIALAEQWPALCDSVAELRTAFVDPTLYERLQMQCRTFAKGPSFPETPITGIHYLTPADSTVEAVPEGDFFAYLAAKYPNRVLYIDVYATWCAPCRAEMKYAPMLHEAFSEQEVVFVNLCLASPFDHWRRLMTQNPIEGENYWFDPDATNLFRATYRLSGYPTYLLVDRQGGLSSLQAGRPSEMEYTIRQIDQLLNE